MKKEINNFINHFKEPTFLFSRMIFFGRAIRIFIIIFSGIIHFKLIIFFKENIIKIKETIINNKITGYLNEFINSTFIKGKIIMTNKLCNECIMKQIHMFLYFK